MKRNTYILLVVFVLVLISFALLFSQKTIAPITDVPGGSVSNEEDAAVRAMVVEFGSKLKNVSLLQPAPDVKSQMHTYYAQYLKPELLAAWQADPAAAIGRSVSSPWPDRLEVFAVTKQGSNEYKVEGNVIEVSSFEMGTQPAAVYPVTLIVEKVNGKWLISKLEKGAYSELPKRVVMRGLWECLPHKNTSGPQTMECAFGLAVDQSDAHYALNLEAMSQYAPNYPMGSHIEVQGLLVPANQLNSNMWQIYPIDGIISVTSIKEI